MKRWLRLVIAVAVIAALLVVLVLMRRSPADGGGATDLSSTGATGERVTILDVGRESISSIEIDRDDDLLVVRAAGDGSFAPEYRYDVRWARSRVERIVGSATSLTSSRAIEENPADLAQFGLAEPRASVRINLEDGSAVGLEIGNPVPGGGGYYVKKGGDPAVYSVATAWMSPFFFALDDLRDKSLPQVNPAELQEIAIDTVAGRSIRVVRVAEDDPELRLSAMTVVSPFQRRYPASSTWLDELAQSVPSIRIDRYTEDYPANPGSYGLDPPEATVRLRDAQSVLALEFGERADGGRYARLPGGNSVFVVEGAEDIVATRPYETVSAFAYIISIDLVDRVVVRTDGKEYNARIERTPAEDPEAEPDATFYYNGEEMEEDLFKDLYQWMIGLLVDAETDRAVDGEPELSITYTLNTGQPDVTISFVPLDSNYLAVFRDGVAEFKIARNKIARLKSVLADPASIGD